MGGKSSKSKNNKDKGKLYEDYAQCWKLALEAQQRFERGLRKEYATKDNNKK